MASVVPHDVPAFLLGELPRQARFGVATPATRWRVLVEESEPVNDDLLLRAVLGLHQAGERSASRISDLLQLPIELVQHLQARAGDGRMRVRRDGGMAATQQRVQWVYRDLVTDEVYPQPSPEVPSQFLQFSQGDSRAILQQGTAGAPRTVQCLVMKAELHPSAVPTPLELSRFEKSGKRMSKRMAVVSEGQLCLVVSRLERQASGFVISTTNEVRHGGLTRALQRSAEIDGRVMEWLDRVPLTAQELGPAHESKPLAWAMESLKSATTEWQVEPSADAARTVMSHLDLLLRRYCDEASYQSEDAGAQTKPEPASREYLTSRLRLAHDDAVTLVSARNDSAALPIRELVTSARAWSRPSLQELSELAAIGAIVVRVGQVDVSVRNLDRITARANSLCEALLEPLEAAHGK